MIFGLDGVKTLLGRGLVYAAVLILVLAGEVRGHAYLKTSNPAEDSTVANLPQEVRLVFTEPIEVRFSILKVYRLDADPAEETRRLNAKAGALVSAVLQKRGDESERADARVDSAARTTTDIVLKLKPDLKPGPYVVMWRVLSIDTHTTQGFYVFIVTPKR